MMPIAIYPRLARVAREVFGIPLPVTSTPSERIFSTAGLIVTSILWLYYGPTFPNLCWLCVCVCYHNWAAGTRYCSDTLYC